MRGLKRLAGKSPRWAVERERISDKGNARWFTVEKFYDPVEAFEHMLSERGRDRVRVFDRREKQEVLWPGHTYRMPSKFFGSVHGGINRTRGFDPQIWSDKIAYDFNREMMQTLQNVRTSALRVQVDKIKINRPAEYV